MLTRVSIALARTLTHRWGDFNSSSTQTSQSWDRTELRRLEVREKTIMIRELRGDRVLEPHMPQTENIEAISYSESGL
jgi:hypothetical protein